MTDPTCPHCGAWPKPLGGWVCACGAARDLELIRAREVANLLNLAAVAFDTPAGDELIECILRALAGADCELATLRALEHARAVAGLPDWGSERRAAWLAELRRSAAVLGAERCRRRRGRDRLAT